MKIATYIYKHHYDQSSETLRLSCAKLSERNWGSTAKMNLASSNQEASDQVWYIQASQANQKYQGYRHYKLQDF